jgi:hypothetical protein
MGFYGGVEDGEKQSEPDEKKTKKEHKNFDFPYQTIHEYERRYLFRVIFILTSNWRNSQ